MPLATALVTGNDPEPQIAEAAVEEALAKSGLAHATGVLLFLTPEFARHASAIVTAAARRAQCLQIVGGIASGVFTEAGWALDRPAAAALVLGGSLSLGYPDNPQEPILSYAGGSVPEVWSLSGRRFGGEFGSTFAVRAADANAVVWQQARLAGEGGCSVQLHGARIDIGVSRGWKRLGETQAVERSQGYEVLQVGGQPALKSLADALPTPFRHDPGRHLHQIVALVAESAATGGNTAFRQASIISINADGTLTLTERIDPGRRLAWAIRLPETAEADMRHTVETLAEKQRTCGQPPAAALMFSCIGRSPFFYGGEDRDLKAVTERFPGLPIIGVYGTGQIAPLGDRPGAGNGQFQNSVVTALVTSLQQNEESENV